MHGSTKVWNVESTAHFLFCLPCMLEEDEMEALWGARHSREWYASCLGYNTRQMEEISILFFPRIFCVRLLMMKKGGAKNIVLYFVIFEWKLSVPIFSKPAIVPRRRGCLDETADIALWRWKWKRCPTPARVHVLLSHLSKFREFMLVNRKFLCDQRNFL